MAPYLPCKICKQTNFDPNTHQCNWAVLEGACEHPRKWEMECVSNDFYEAKKKASEGWEPFDVTPETENCYQAYYFRRIKPCEECEKV